MLETTKVIPAMTVSQALFLTASILKNRWSEGLLNCDLDQIDKASRAVSNGLYDAGINDDLDLAVEPLDVIFEALLNSHTINSNASDMAVAVYEALIDAGCLPGVNARHIIASD